MKDEIKESGDAFEVLLHLLRKHRVAKFNNAQIMVEFHPSAFEQKPAQPEPDPEPVAMTEEQIRVAADEQKKRLEADLFYSAI